METVLLPIAVIIFFSFFLLHRNLIRPTAPSSLSLHVFSGCFSFTGLGRFFWALSFQLIGSFD